MEKQGLGFKQVFNSLVAGAVGVQSKDDWQRDFTQGRFIHYVIGGVIFTAAFVVGLMVLVNWLIATS